MLESLLDKIESKEKKLSETTICCILNQVFQGLAFMHKLGIFHRDIKPENVLCNGNQIKIADFGLAREMNSQLQLTEYISTRWYRAPELLLGSKSYSSPIDIWAVGVVMAEMFLLEPIFPGLTDFDQLYKICSLLGSPSPKTWPEGQKLAKNLNYHFPQFLSLPLEKNYSNSKS